MLRQYVDLACQDDEPDAGARQLLGGKPRPKPPPRSKAGGGTSPLHLASCRGHVGVVHELLLAGADATRGDQFGFSALHLAARHGFPDVIAELLSFGKMSVDMLDESGETALHTAARYAKTLSVWRLLESGSDWTIVSKSGRRAIDVIGQGQDKHNLQSLPHSATQLCSGRRAVKFSASANMPPAQLPRDKCTEERVRRLLTGAARKRKDRWSWPVGETACPPPAENTKTSSSEQPPPSPRNPAAADNNGINDSSSSSIADADENEAVVEAVDVGAAAAAPPAAPRGTDGDGGVPNGNGIADEHVGREGRRGKEGGGGSDASGVATTEMATPTRTQPPLARLNVRRLVKGRSQDGRIFEAMNRYAYTTPSKPGAAPRAK